MRASPAGSDRLRKYWRNVEVFGEEDTLGVMVQTLCWKRHAALYCITVFGSRRATRNPQVKSETHKKVSVVRVTLQAFGTRFDVTELVSETFYEVRFFRKANTPLPCTA